MKEYWNKFCSIIQKYNEAGDDLGKDAMSRWSWNRLDCLYHEVKKKRRRTKKMIVMQQQLKFQTLAYCMSFKGFIHATTWFWEWYVFILTLSGSILNILVSTHTLSQPQMYSFPLLCYFFSTSRLNALVLCPFERLNFSTCSKNVSWRE
jgi:hypothetical protein